MNEIKKAEEQLIKAITTIGKKINTDIPAVEALDYSRAVLSLANAICALKSNC